MIDDLIKWNSRWRLNRHVVSCRVCLSMQEESDRGLAFSHQAGCWCAHENSNPWEELDKACGKTAPWTAKPATKVAPIHAR
ncbi:hypothetical protein [Pseudomonas floridensis]|nr:hypothetical protein [Pseudomonas floridensis]